MNEARLDLAGRVAIVTGAGRGLGRAHAMMLASRGARVVVNDLPNASRDSAGSAHAVVREIETMGGRATACEADVVQDSVAIVDTAMDRFGRLDIVVCNAGVLQPAAFEVTPALEWDTGFDVNFQGVAALCRAAWPRLAAAGAGRIITTGSSGMLGNVGLSSYAAAKGAIFGFVRCLALEGAVHGITVNMILPSAYTRMVDTIDEPGIMALLRSRFQPEHVSALVVWLAHQDTSITNEVIQVGAGSASRLVMATYPSVRPGNAQPEAWVIDGPRLFEDGAMVPFKTAADLFAFQLAEADPDDRGSSTLLKHGIRMG